MTAVPQKGPVAAPVFERTADGGLGLTWSSGRLVVHIELHPDGRFEWFYRDRYTNEVDGTEDGSNLPDINALWRRLMRTFCTVHIVHCGVTLCNFMPGIWPGDWPSGHRWVRWGEEGATCEKCMEADGRAARGPAPEAGYTCRKCGRVSYNPNDAAHGYCSACHEWTGLAKTERGR